MKLFFKSEVMSLLLLEVVNKRLKDKDKNIGLMFAYFIHKLLALGDGSMYLAKMYLSDFEKC